MQVEAGALETAQELFIEMLRREAEQQHAYVSVHSDGLVSLELEGLDFRTMIHAVVAVYLDQAVEAERSGNVRLVACN